jgi:hypothetical protein
MMGEEGGGLFAALSHSYEEFPMRMKQTAIPVALLMVLALAVVFTPWTTGGQQMSEQEKKMMEQMMKYGTPGPNHELFKKYVGDWDVEIKMWQDPAAQPMVSKGMYKNELLFGGRFLKGQFEGEMGGMKAMGLEVIGYDLFKKMYTTFWIDSWSTAFAMTSGTLDATGKVLTETGAYPDAMTDGKTMQKMKNVTTFLEDGKYRFEMFMVGSDGKETKSMEFVCTRKK